MSIQQQLKDSANELNQALKAISFEDVEAVAHIYYPWDYAGAVYHAYLDQFATKPKKVLFLGMNPGPFGMTQTGIPFGQVEAVRDWMQLPDLVEEPETFFAKRPIVGFACERSEVSGERLWGLFSQKYPVATDFFEEHIVMNYCPIIWLGVRGQNITPDKLPQERIQQVEQHCLNHLAQVVQILQIETIVGVGAYAHDKAKQLQQEYELDSLNLAKILHPSPASPAANRGWAEQAQKQLIDQEIWS